jgi:phytoene dehydrogenase-like protein
VTNSAPPSGADSDAVVIGSGPNGLVAANLLADAGWAVVVIEAADQPGGAVRTAEVTAPGFRNDLFSAFYPLAVVSRPIVDLGLEAYGLRWRHAPLALANPTPDGPTALLSRDLDETAASVERFAPGDGAAWRRFYDENWPAIEAFVDVITEPLGAVQPIARLARRVGMSNLLPFARNALVTVRRMAEENFQGEGARLLLAGNALHSDISPEGAGSGLFGMLLALAAQRHGFPVPEGGSQSLTNALIKRLEARGGRVMCGQEVTRVIIHEGRAVGVRTTAGDIIARRGVLADCNAVPLYRRLVGEDHLPARLVDGLARFHHGPATVKVDWALSSKIPWTDGDVGRAGTVHLAASLGHLSRWSADIVSGVVPAEPFVLLGQMTTADPTRSPEGTEAAWGYTHVPSEIAADAGGDGIAGRWDEKETEAIARRVEETIERYAPGFIDRIIARHILTPPRLEELDANLIGGDIGAGTSNLHQQLIFRPVAGSFGPRTPIRGLWLASASAHPGGGVHGACGANAAKAAIASWRRRRVFGGA